jgi:putative transposase
MGRARRVDVGGRVYHVWNRANFRSRLFRNPAQYRAFLGIVEESLDFEPMRLLAYCLMPNHWIWSFTRERTAIWLRSSGASP